MTLNIREAQLVYIEYVGATVPGKASSDPSVALNLTWREVK